MPTAKKKVLFTSHTANFHKFNRPFMRMLKEQGYEVHYASAGEEKVYDTDKHFDIPFERSPFKFGNLKAYFALKKIIDREGYDLIHTHTPMGSVVTRLAARTARKNGTRVIYTAHGFHFFKGAPLLNWAIYYPIEKYMASHTDTLITINNEDFERAKKKFKTKVEHVPGVGVDLKKFIIGTTEDDRIKFRKSIGLGGSDFVIVYVAELNKNKDQKTLLKITKELISKEVPVKLVLCGAGDFRPKYQSAAVDFGIAKSVVFTGYRNDVGRILRSSDVYVASSIREGLGLSLIEAAAAGLPIVASNNRGHRTIVGARANRWNRIFEIGDVMGAVEILEDIYRNSTYYQKNRPDSSLDLSSYDIKSVKLVMADLYGVDAV